MNSRQVIDADRAAMPRVLETLTKFVFRQNAPSEGVPVPGTSKITKNYRITIGCEENGYYKGVGTLVGDTLFLSKART